MTVVPEQHDRLLILDSFTFDRKDKELLRITPFLIYLSMNSQTQNCQKELQNWSLGQCKRQEAILSEWIREFDKACLQWRLAKRQSEKTRCFEHQNKTLTTQRSSLHQSAVYILLTSHHFYMNIVDQKPEAASPMDDLLYTKLN